MNDLADDDTACVDCRHTETSHVASGWDRPCLVEDCGCEDYIDPADAVEREA